MVNMIMGSTMKWDETVCFVKKPENWHQARMRTVDEKRGDTFWVVNETETRTKQEEEWIQWESQLANMFWETISQYLHEHMSMIDEVSIS